MIANLADLDAFVASQVLEDFDRKSLNEMSRHFAISAHNRERVH